MATEETTINNSNLEETLNDESFVGIYFHKGVFDIKFPLGYRLPEKPQANSDRITIKKYELQRRRDILTLIRVLMNYQSKNISHQEKKDRIENLPENFPLYAYMYLYNYYRQNGYYIPKEIRYSKSTSGKVNWNKTIKQIDPIISNNNIVYLETIRSRNSLNENELITNINKYCVYQSFLKIGCLFSSRMVREEKLRISPKNCLKFLTEKIRNTFNSEDIKLFTNMKKIIETESNETNDDEYYFGTNSFHSVWEYMVNQFFGEDDKTRELYNPKLRWYDTNSTLIKGQSSNLRPDTIAFMKEGKEHKVFILDSKYYKGSVNLSDGHLPLSESVPKQLVYANWAKNQMKEQSDNIYNAFIMQDNLSNSQTAVKANKLTIEHYGFVRPEWLSDDEFKNPKTPYNRIQGMKIDTKDMMENYLHKNKTDFEYLLKLIEKEADCINKYTYI